MLLASLVYVTEIMNKFILQVHTVYGITCHTFLNTAPKSVHTATGVPQC